MSSFWHCLLHLQLSIYKGCKRKHSTSLFYFNSLRGNARGGIFCPFFFQKSLICMNNLLSSTLQNNSSSCLGKKGGCLLLFIGYFFLWAYQYLYIKSYHSYQWWMQLGFVTFLSGDKLKVPLMTVIVWNYAH